jgi:hypothetical protein
MGLQKPVCLVFAWSLLLPYFLDSQSNHYKSFFKRPDILALFPIDRLGVETYSQFSTRPLRGIHEQEAFD